MQVLNESFSAGTLRCLFQSGLPCQFQLDDLVGYLSQIRTYHVWAFHQWAEDHAGAGHEGT